MKKLVIFRFDGSVYNHTCTKIVYIKMITSSYNMIPSIVDAKSIFNIRPLNKKSVTVGFLWFTLIQLSIPTVYSLIRADINILPSSCQRNEFTNHMCCIQNDDSCFMYEILQFHNNSLSDMILYGTIIIVIGNVTECP
ncbi:Uncharacterized protein FWK35_00027062 [Aphis craccivora]|uniref:Uncharacterized protein n=1 Tax=Aphis craccivora TaxID=307492 RepID=A0A6G0W6X1_APHCR|nr:Uncharacterized protein FWK35_00027062 [Aphis craccivora]